VVAGLTARSGGLPPHRANRQAALSALLPDARAFFDQGQPGLFPIEQQLLG
jgi:hypothetical protein